MLKFDDLRKAFEPFTTPDSIVGRILVGKPDGEVLTRLLTINETSLSQVELNQLLLLSREAAVSDAFFDYYWLSAPSHTYDLGCIEGYQDAWGQSKKIISLDHLVWGLKRIHVDGLLYFGNIRRGFQTLRSKNFRDLTNFFAARRFDTAAIKRRGAPLPLRHIAKDDRYLISEMACKSYGTDPFEDSGLRTALLEAWGAHREAGGGGTSMKRLLDGELMSQKYQYQQYEFRFSTDEMAEEEVSSEAELIKKYEGVAKRFSAARISAMANTDLYLSMINDLDVYVATSMRTRRDFREMADNCDRIFSDTRLRELHLRYFDPTLSAATGHEDKGIIECLMVKSAKVLIYTAGERDSYGKDAEAAMALSLGKPVLFLCDQAMKQRFFRDVHPLSRLIHFETGIAVGAIVASSINEVSELLYRLFENKMQYELERRPDGYLRLKEKLTGSVVRLQTNNTLLTEVFWNYYHHRPRNEEFASS